MSTPTQRSLRQLLMVLALASGALQWGCSTAPAVMQPSSANALEHASAQALDALLSKGEASSSWRGWKEGVLPWQQRKVLLAPVVEGHSGEQTLAGDTARRAVAARLVQHTSYLQLPLRSEAVAQAAWFIRGTLSPSPVLANTAAQAQAQLQLELFDIRTGARLAQVMHPVTQAGLDFTPLAFHRDNPVVMPPAPAQDFAAQRLPALASLGAAIDSYNAGRIDDALAGFRLAETFPQADANTALVGQYLSLLKRAEVEPAQAVFKRIIAAGLDSRSVGLKLLFAPGGTQFWPDPVLTARYQEWVAELAHQVLARNDCLEVVGHASRSGAEDFNQRLSKQRAAAVMALLQGYEPGLTPRLSAEGKGFSQVIVGSGTDDHRDAVDRRVEFKRLDCRR